MHKTLNSSRGVIRCRELSVLSEVEIRDELKSQGVVEVHRLAVRKEGKTPTPLLHESSRCVHVNMLGHCIFDYFLCSVEADEP